nr:hypothetical protein CPGR_00571 [Mycolicibacterium malmesburyense]
MRFTVRRPADTEVSPCCHRPSGGDVACSVHVGIARLGGAGLALEDRLALAVSRCGVPTTRASLRRVRGRDLLDPTTSFLLQPRSEQSPTASTDSPIQRALLGYPLARPLGGSACAAGHRPHVEGFDADCVETPRDIRSGFLDPVLASVPLNRFDLGDRALRADPSLGSPLCAGQALLQHLQTFRLTDGEAWRVQQFTRRQGRRNHHAAVYTHHAAIVGTCDGLGDIGERDMPTTSAITGDSVRLHSVWDWTRHAEADPADFGHPHPAAAAVQTFHVMGFHCDLAESFVHAGFAPGRAAMSPVEKISHRLREVPQRLLLHGLRTRRQPTMLGASRGQLSALLDVARGMTPRAPMLLLLDGQIPHKAGVATMLVQRGHLIRNRKQPVSSHTSNVATNTDKSARGVMAAAPTPRAEGFPALRIR